MFFRQSDMLIVFFSVFRVLSLHILTSSEYPREVPDVPGFAVSFDQSTRRNTIYQCVLKHIGRLTHCHYISFNSYSYFLLIEHEHLYDIIMRNIKNPFSQWASRNHTAFPALPGLYVEQPDIQGRFILKPREPARIQKQNSESLTFLQVALLSPNFYSV